VEIRAVSTDRNLLPIVLRKTRDAWITFSGKEGQNPAEEGSTSRAHRGDRRQQVVKGVDACENCERAAVFG
jgi:hypothetical protein